MRTHARTRKRTHFSVFLIFVTHQAPEGRDGLVCVDGLEQKPFNTRWDAGKTTVLICLEYMEDTRKVKILTPRGRTVIAEVSRMNCWEHAANTWKVKVRVHRGLYRSLSFEDMTDLWLRESYQKKKMESFDLMYPADH